MGLGLPSKALTSGGPLSELHNALWFPDGNGSVGRVMWSCNGVSSGFSSFAIATGPDDAMWLTGAELPFNRKDHCGTGRFCLPQMAGLRRPPRDRSKSAVCRRLPTLLHRHASI